MLYYIWYEIEIKTIILYYIILYYIILYYIILYYIILYYIILYYIILYYIRNESMTLFLFFIININKNKIFSKITSNQKWKFKWSEIKQA